MHWSQGLSRCSPEKEFPLNQKTSSCYGITPREKAEGKLIITNFHETFIDQLWIFYRYVFIEFRTNDEAAFALTAMQGYPFDAKHTFAVNLFSDIERFAKMDEKYVEPKVEEYVPRVRVDIALFLYLV
jgi:hypothetical protein